MPFYKYKCKNESCNIEYEVFYTSISKVEEEEPTEKCPKCDSTEKEKLVATGTSFILKGNNWAAKGKRGY